MKKKKIYEKKNKCEKYNKNENNKIQIKQQQKKRSTVKPNKRKL